MTLAILLCATFFQAMAPASGSATFPIHDDFTSDSIADGFWTVEDPPKWSYAITGGRIWMNLTGSAPNGGGGLSKEVVGGLGNRSVFEAKVTPHRLYRFGITFSGTTAGNSSVDLELDDWGSCVCRTTMNGQWQLGSFNYRPVVGQTYIVRLTLEDGNKANGKIFTSDGVLISQVSLSDVRLLPADVNKISFSVWRDHSSNPLSSYSVDYVDITTTARALPPSGLTITRGPDVQESQIAWSPPAADADRPVAEFRIYRAPVGGNEALIATVPPDITNYADVMPDCTRSFAYRVSAFYEDGTSASTTSSTSDPDPRLEMLCLLGNSLPFYWSGITFDNTAGDPLAPPRSFAAIADEAPRLPLWFGKDPTRVHCCDVFSVDLNTLKDARPEREIHWLQPMSYISNDVAQSLTKALRKTTFDIEDDGIQFLGTPVAQSPGAHVPGFVASRVKMSMEGHPVVVVEGQAGGDLVLDASTDQIRQDNLDSILIALELPVGPRLFWNKTFNGVETVKLGRWFSVDLGVEAKVSAQAALTANAAMGAKADTDSRRPVLVLGGAGASGYVEALAQVEWHLVAETTTQLSTGASAGAKLEAIVPLVTGPGQTFYSGYTGILYRDVTQPAVTLKLEPGGFDGIRLSIPVKIGRWEIGIDETWFEQSWPARAWTVGTATVEGNGFTVTKASLMGLQEATSTLETDDLDLVFNVAGAPGSTGSVTITRPIGFYLPNGTYAVDTWSVTLPGVGIGSDGTATLHVDTLDLQTAVQDATLAGIPWESALAEANLRLDANGDGQPDLLAQAVPDANLAPTSVRLMLTTEGPLSKGEVHTAIVNVSGPTTAIPVQGAVQLFVGPAQIAQSPLDPDGTAHFDFELPPALEDGLQDLRAVFTGGPGTAASTATRHIGVTEAPPRLVIVTPEALSAQGGPQVDVALGAISLDITNLEIRVDEGPWTHVNGTTATVDVTGMSEGFHILEARATDTAGLTTITSTTFAVDTRTPVIEWELAETVNPDGRLEITWTASEPVGVTLIATSAAGEEHVAYSESFDSSGALGLALPAGVYVVTAEFVDAGARGPEPPRIPPAPKAFVSGKT